MAAGSGLAAGVDLGTTYTCAAVSEPPGARARVVQLAGASQTIPSVVSVTDDGVVAGEAAERRLVTHPAATAREFKRRFGDAAPIVLGDRAFGAEVLSGHLLAEVLERTERNEGTRPSVVGIAHPASWGPFRLDLLRDAARQAGVDDVVLVPEPVAAAVANRSRIDDGSLVAVYDLGGGTFDAAIVRVGGGGASGVGGDVEVIGTPEGVERLGGIDFDQAIMAHVDSVLDGQVFALDSGDPQARSALMRLRAECQAAKEHLSQDTDAEIAVALPSVQTSVRITRAELEAMVQRRLVDSLAVFDRVVASAGVTWDDIACVLLVGGSSNIPIVAQTVGEHTGRPVMTATSPHLAIALGTAMVAAASAVPPLPPPVVAAPPPPSSGAGDPAGVAAGSPGSSRRLWPVLVGALVAVAVAAVGFVVLGGDDDTADEAPVATESADDTTAPAADEPAEVVDDGSDPDPAADPDADGSTDTDPSDAAEEPADVGAAPLVGGELPSFISDFDRVCTTGVGFDGATPYDGGPAPHPVVLLQESDSGLLIERFIELPAGWAVEADTDFDDNSDLAVAQLVACSTIGERTPTGIQCELEVDEGSTVTLSLVDVAYELEVYAAATGELLGATTIETAGTRCPFVAFVDDGQTEYLNSPDADAYIRALQPFVAP